MLNAAANALPADRNAGPADRALQPAEASTNLVLRNDTMLGVCEALGQDFGFHANWLRVPLAGMVLISPLWAFGIYFALGIGVLASRLAYPRRVATAPRPAARPLAPTADNQTDEERLAA